MGSKINVVMPVRRGLGLKVEDTPPLAGKALSQKTGNLIISTTRVLGIHLYGNVCLIDLTLSLITLIHLSMAGTCSLAAVTFRIIL